MVFKYLLSFWCCVSEMRLEAIILVGALSACAVSDLPRKDSLDVVRNVSVENYVDRAFEERYFIDGKSVRFAKETDFYIIELIYSNGL